MSAADALEKVNVIAEDGSPSEVVIPYEKFMNFIEANGLDSSEEDRAGIGEAAADRAAGKRDAIAGLEEILREFGCVG